MPTLTSYEYAVIRIVPRVDREEFVNAGVILFARTVPFLAARVVLDRARVSALAPTLDLADVERQLALFPLICDGDPAGGPIAALTRPERFHWLVAPRSTVIQLSPVHAGLCDDPQAALEHLVETLVEAPGNEPQPPLIARPEYP
jgi:hypothetical protein